MQAQFPLIALAECCLVSVVKSAINRVLSLGSKGARSPLIYAPIITDLLYSTAHIQTTDALCTPYSTLRRALVPVGSRRQSRESLVARLVDESQVPRGGKSHSRHNTWS